MSPGSDLPNGHDLPARSMPSKRITIPSYEHQHWHYTLRQKIKNKTFIFIDDSFIEVRKVIFQGHYIDVKNSDEKVWQKWITWGEKKRDNDNHYHLRDPEALRCEMKW